MKTKYLGYTIESESYQVTHRVYGDGEQTDYFVRYNILGFKEKFSNIEDVKIFSLKELQRVRKIVNKIKQLEQQLRKAKRLPDKLAKQLEKAESMLYDVIESKEKQC